MKKLFSAVLLLALLIMSVLPVSAAPSKGILVMGDSIATGYGLNGYKGARPGEAADSFGAKLAAEYGLVYGHSYYNFAVDGMTSAELAAALESGKSWKMHKDNATLGTSEYQYSQYAVADSSAAQTALKNCDTIVISIGGNDLLRPMFEIIFEYIEANSALLKTLGIDASAMAGSDAASIPSMLSGPAASAMMTALTTLFTSEASVAKFTENAAQFAGNLAAITDAIYKANPKADVYFLCLYNPFDGIEMFKPMAELTETFITQLSDAVTAHAAVMAKAGRSFTPVYVKEAFAGKAMTMTNMLAYDIHPNAAGHAAMFEAFKAAINAPKTASAVTVYAPSTSDAVILCGIAALVSGVVMKSVRRRK